MKGDLLDVSRVIDEEFRQTLPIIHEESPQDYTVILVTRYGVRIEKRCPSEELARRTVNELVAKRKGHPVAANQTG